MMQHEITSAAPLLDASGNLREPGWARSLLPVYCRSQIRAPKSRIKEWDYYLVTDGHIGIALTIADNGYMGLDSVSFLNFDERWQITKSPMRAFPMGKTGLPETSVLGASEIAASGYALAFYHEDGARRLSFHMDRFRGKDAIEGIITLTDEPDESLVIATPFEKPGHFYYNQKINCLRASGWVELGAERFELMPDKFFAVLDWAVHAVNGELAGGCDGGDGSGHMDGAENGRGGQQRTGGQGDALGNEEDPDGLAGHMNSTFLFLLPYALPGGDITRGGGGKRTVNSGH